MIEHLKHREEEAALDVIYSSIEEGVLDSKLEKILLVEDWSALNNANNKKLIKVLNYIDGKNPHPNLKLKKYLIQKKLGQQDFSLDELVAMWKDDPHNRLVKQELLNENWDSLSSESKFVYLQILNQINDISQEKTIVKRQAILEKEVGSQDQAFRLHLKYLKSYPYDIDIKLSLTRGGWKKLSFEEQEQYKLFLRTAILLGGDNNAKKTLAIILMNELELDESLSLFEDLVEEKIIDSKIKKALSAKVWEVLDSNLLDRFNILQDKLKKLEKTRNEEFQLKKTLAFNKKEKGEYNDSLKLHLDLISLFPSDEGLRRSVYSGGWTHLNSDLNKRLLSFLSEEVETGNQLALKTRAYLLKEMGKTNDSFEDFIRLYESNDNDIEIINALSAGEWGDLSTSNALFLKKFLVHQYSNFNHFDSGKTLAFMLKMDSEEQDLALSLHIELLKLKRDPGVEQSLLSGGWKHLTQVSLNLFKDFLCTDLENIEKSIALVKLFAELKQDEDFIKSLNTIIDIHSLNPKIGQVLLEITWPESSTVDYQKLLDRLSDLAVEMRDYQLLKLIAFKHKQLSRFEESLKLHLLVYSQDSKDSEILNSILDTQWIGVSSEIWQQYLKLIEILAFIDQNQKASNILLDYSLDESTEINESFRIQLKLLKLNPQNKDLYNTFFQREWVEIDDINRKKLIEIYDREFTDSKVVACGKKLLFYLEAWGKKKLILKYLIELVTLEPTLIEKLYHSESFIVGKDQKIQYEELLFLQDDIRAIDILLKIFDIEDRETDRFLYLQGLLQRNIQYDYLYPKFFYFKWSRLSNEQEKTFITMCEKQVDQNNDLILIEYLAKYYQKLEDLDKALQYSLLKVSLDPEDKQFFSSLFDKKWLKLKEEGMELYINFLKQFSHRSFEACDRLGEIFESKNDKANQLEFCLQALINDPKKLSLVDKLLFFEDADFSKEQKEVWSKVLKENFNYKDCGKRLAFIQKELGNINDSFIAHLEYAAQHNDPQIIRPLIENIWDGLTTENLKAHFEFLKQSQYNQDTKALFTLALVSKQLKHLDDSLYAHIKYLETGGDSHHIINSLVLGGWEELSDSPMQKYLEFLQQYKDDNRNARVTLAHLLKLSGNKDEALSVHIMEMMEEKPDSSVFESFFLEDWSTCKSKTLEQAAQIFKSTPQNSDYYKRSIDQLLTIYKKIEKNEDYIDCLTLKVEKDDFQIFGDLIELAECLVKSSRASEALRFYQKAREIQPKSTDLLKSMGWIYKEQKNFSKALAYFEATVKIDPNDKVAKEEITRISSGVVFKVKSLFTKKEVLEI